MEIINGTNHKLAIATGKSRFEKKWKNTEILWPDLLKRLSNTHRTFESLQDYAAKDKTGKGNIKDVGGFVGGHLKDGVRRNGHVVNRSIISLDADYAPPKMWEDVELIADYAIAVYSTHGHTPKKPRLRFLVPLTTPVTPEEYEAIARKIADSMGMDYFDDTTYEPTRLMYWPTTAKDGEYVFNYLDLPILDPQLILDEYDDWRDTSYWPESSRSNGIRNKLAAKQGDPILKPGLIGAFCRTYDIAGAIETFLSDVYIPCATEGRYTYTRGSTAAGLVTYDDKFAYSNHSTDPANGQLCNAFDLVRIHKFGEFDKDAKEDTPVNKLPSWGKMMDLITSDDETKTTIGKEHLAAAAADFDIDIEDLDDKDGDTTDGSKDDSLKWLKRLHTKKTGEYEGSIENLVIILQNDPHVKNAIKYNVFSERLEVVRKKLPWPRRDPYWTDTDDAGLRYYIEKVYKIEGRQKIMDALAIVAEEKAYHPVKDYLEDQIWDGTPRVETLLVEYLGSADSLYTRTITRKTLVAAVKRIYEPGCKFDYMLTIHGDQGIGKSMLIQRLGHNWFSDTLVDIRGKEAYEALDGVWLMEMAELAALKRSELEATKNYISKREDKYRRAYNRHTSINKRQNIFIGTTNEDDFLKDATGGRRFWVVPTDVTKRTKTVWDDFNDEERDQVWAEAMEIYHAGENVMSLPAEIAIEARETQDAYSQESIYMSAVREFMDRRVPANWYQMTMAEQRAWYNATDDFKADDTEESIELVEHTKVCPQEIWYVALKEDKLPIPSPYTTKELKDCITKSPGWKRDKNIKRYGDYGMQKGCSKSD